MFSKKGKELIFQNHYQIFCENIMRQCIEKTKLIQIRECQVYVLLFVWLGNEGEIDELAIWLGKERVIV